MRKTRVGWGETDHARLIFGFLVLFVSLLYYLRAWHRLYGVRRWGRGLWARDILNWSATRETDLVERISFMTDFLKVRESFYFIARVY